jgi:hypothetical protein
MKMPVAGFEPLILGLWVECFAIVLPGHNPEIILKGPIRAGCGFHTERKANV